jgi:hypothetical protein
MRYGYKSKDILNFHNRVTQQETLPEIQEFMENWNQKLYEDIDQECITLKETKGARLAGLYVFGACQALAAAKEENGGLPQVLDGQYELDKEVYDSSLAASDKASDEYFNKLKEILGDRFHMTQLMLLLKGGILVNDNVATEQEVADYYQAGANKVLYTLAPLFLDHPER